jgi:hypothetical protein
VNLVDFLKPKLEPIGVQHHGTTQRCEQNQQNQATPAPGTRTAAAKAEALLKKIKESIE